MNPLALLALVSASQTPAQPPAPTVNPYLLAIGRPGTLTVQPNQMINAISGAQASADDVAAAADRTQWVYVGENHDQLAHHQMQADVIAALVKRGRDVVVGFEQFTRPYQSSLNGWTLGWWTEEEFQAKADWKANWGMEYKLYKPIFDVIKINRLPMVALNLPRDWVRRVSRGGMEALTAEERATIPDLDVSNENHFKVFEALMQGHPTGGKGGIYRGQALWDIAMADSAIKYLSRRANTAKTVFVVVAGSGHVMYGQGINYRVWKRTGDAGITVTMIQSPDPINVSRGLGDFVYSIKGS